MAIEVKNGSVANFGNIDAETVHTRFRIKKGSIVLGTAVLDNSRTVPANRSAEFAVGTIKLKFLKGAFEDAGIKEMCELYFDTGVTIECFVDSTTEVSAGGYSDVTTSSWTYTVVND